MDSIFSRSDVLHMNHGSSRYLHSLYNVDVQIHFGVQKQQEFKGNNSRSQLHGHGQQAISLDQKQKCNCLGPVGGLRLKEDCGMRDG